MSVTMMVGMMVEVMVPMLLLLQLIGLLRVHHLMTEKSPLEQLQMLSQSKRPYRVEALLSLVSAMEELAQDELQ